MVSSFSASQWTGHPTRSEDVVEVDREQLPNSEWIRITPKWPLPPGEYGLVLLPLGKELFSNEVFDFVGLGQQTTSNPQNPPSLAPVEQP